MAWTSSGGELLFIEAVCTEIREHSRPDRPGQTIITGNMGRVMEESCNLALSWIRSSFKFIDSL
jgi:ATP-dependent Lon protease